MSGDDLFWELAEPMLTDSRVSRSTMMGMPCLRCDGGSSPWWITAIRRCW